MIKKGRRLLRLLITLAIVFSLLPGMNLTAKAADVKSLTLKKTAFSLKKGKTAQIKASAVSVNKKLKLIDHVERFRYRSYDNGVAKVDKNGTIPRRLIASAGCAYVSV